MFQIKNLKVDVNEKHILQGVSLKIKPGEIHVVMGPNGSGKSTLANAIAGNPKYKTTDGKIALGGEDLTHARPDHRAQKGILLAFQYPKEIPGVSVLNFLQTAHKAICKARKIAPMNPIEFRKALRERLAKFGLDATFMNRSMNEGFSGGEKKKLEMIQLSFLEPKIAIIDEIDSGLDIDALKVIAGGIKFLAYGGRGVLLITHYKRILQYLKPDFIHVMVCGRIVKSGSHKLADELERKGYKNIHHKTSS
ncbi:Fe-S cluster assembly ATPase SufC [Candidatus Peregrinibacteria bacterium]|nr:Fe-S cluster assembly ATPase SufC [Candidatus Peregrinibacteria bacterium]